ncbi:MAG: tetratricopeptide repeat protein [Thioalkalivibrionaceae bacterium]
MSLSLIRSRPGSLHRPRFAGVRLRPSWAVALAFAPVIWLGGGFEQPVGFGGAAEPMAAETGTSAVLIKVASVVAAFSLPAAATADARQAELLRHRFEMIQARALAGNSNAAFELAQSYLYGWGAPVDEAEGLRWMNTAAEGGNLEADYRLGHLFETGATGPADPVRALHHYRRAGDGGHAAANYWLGVLYMSRDERGQPRDAVQGLDRLERAAKAGDANAAYYLGVLLDSGAAGSGQGMRATEWTRQAAELGQKDAQRRYAQQLLEGRGVSADAVSAYVWFRRAGDTEGERSAWSRMSGAERARAESQLADAR